MSSKGAMRITDLGAFIDAELEFFDSADQRGAFQSFRITPTPATQRWQYSEETHECSNKPLQPTLAKPRAADAVVSH
jgi:hypothetical protein